MREEITRISGSKKEDGHKQWSGSKSKTMEGIANQIAAMFPYYCKEVKNAKQTSTIKA